MILLIAFQQKFKKKEVEKKRAKVEKLKKVQAHAQNIGDNYE